MLNEDSASKISDEDVSRERDDERPAGEVDAVGTDSCDDSDMGPIAGDGCGARTPTVGDCSGEDEEGEEDEEEQWRSDGTTSSDPSSKLSVSPRRLSAEHGDEQSDAGRNTKAADGGEPAHAPFEDGEHSSGEPEKPAGLLW